MQFGKIGQLRVTAVLVAGLFGQTVWAQQSGGEAAQTSAPVQAPGAIGPNQVVPTFGGNMVPGSGGVDTMQPAGARVGEAIFVYPMVGVRAGYNDNVTGANVNQISSPLVSVRPAVVADWKIQGDRFAVGYFGDYTRYTHDSADNFDDHEVQMRADTAFSSRARMSWTLGYVQKHDARGSTDRVQGAEPDRWHAPVGDLLFTYGAPGAAGRIELEASAAAKRYDNNRLVTEVADLNTHTLSGRFFYRVMPKTSLLAEVRDTRFDYQNDVAGLDNNEVRYYVGATWEATAATTGIIKVGQLHKNFDDGSRRNYTGGSWEGIVRWSPLTYSTVDFVSGRSTADPTGVGSYLVNRQNGVTWSHKWTSFVGTRLMYTDLKSSYVDTNRQDDIKTVGFNVYYQLQRWVRLGGELTHVERDSSIDNNDYRKNQAMLTLDMSL